MLRLFDVLIITVMLISMLHPKLASETCKNSDLTRCSGGLGFHFDIDPYDLKIGNQSLKSQRADRLAIMVLHVYDDIDSTKIQSLDCTLRSIIANLELTPKDIFLWVSGEFPSNLLHKDVIPHVKIMKVEKESWCIPKGLSDASKWAWKSHFSVDYYLMGQWRLIFGPDFARSMGYRYYAQIDLDAQIATFLPYNLVQHMSENDFLMGGATEIVFDYPEVLNGLAELTKFWLQISKFQPVATMLRHIATNNLRDLDTNTWDREIIPAYFFMMDLSLWFSDNVQDFLKTILRSGRDIEGRWQEQGVQNMVRQLFVLDSSFFQLSGLQHHVTTCH